MLAARAWTSRTPRWRPRWCGSCTKRWSHFRRPMHLLPANDTRSRSEFCFGFEKLPSWLNGPLFLSDFACSFNVFLSLTLMPMRVQCLRLCKEDIGRQFVHPRAPFVGGPGCNASHADFGGH